MKEWFYHKCGSKIARVEPGGSKVHVWCPYCKKEVEVTFERRNEGLNKFVELQHKKLDKLQKAK